MSRISEAIRTIRGPEQDIIGVGRNDLPAFFKEMGYKVGAEIGVDAGIFSELLAKEGLKIHAVDPWDLYPGYDESWLRNRVKERYAEAQERLSKYDVNIIRAQSMDAVKEFEDNSLDFVYIDAHHDFIHVVNDIYHWSKKVRSGGVISGHDFVRTNVKKGAFTCGVKPAVRGFTDAYNINDWYVLGRKHFPTDPNEVRDRWRSWFWIKP